MCCRLPVILFPQSVEIVVVVSHLCEGQVHKDIDQTNHSLFTNGSQLLGFRRQVFQVLGDFTRGFFNTLLRQLRLVSCFYMGVCYLNVCALT